MAENGNRWPHVPGHGPVSAKLIEKLSTGKPGDVLTDEELKAVAGVDCRPESKGYPSLGTAIRNVERGGVVWRRERGAGCIRCLKSVERFRVADASRKHVSRVSKRALRVVSTASILDLPEDERPDANATIAQLRAIAAFSATDTRKKLAARNVTSAPDMAKMLESFPR